MDHIVTTKEQAILRIRLNRMEKKNALTTAMYTAMSDALDQAAADDATRVVFFEGTGGCFTSGNDILDFMNCPPTDENSPVMRFLSALVHFPKPIVAAVTGPAVGIGTTMLLHCDLAYAGSKAVFRMPFVNLGLCPEAGSSYLLPQLIGHTRAAELLLLGEKFDAEKAVCYGICNEMLPDDELIERALKKAAQLAAQPPAAVRLSKSLMRQPHREMLTAVMAREGAEFVQRLQSPEAIEAFTAFMEGRKPDFSAFS